MRNKQENYRFFSYLLVYICQKHFSQQSYQRKCGKPIQHFDRSPKDTYETNRVVH